MSTINGILLNAELLIIFKKYRVLTTGHGDGCSKRYWRAEYECHQVP